MTKSPDLQGFFDLIRDCFPCIKSYSSCSPLSYPMHDDLCPFAHSSYTCSLLPPSYCTFAFGTMHTRSRTDARTPPYTCTLVIHRFHYCHRPIARSSSARCALIAVQIRRRHRTLAHSSYTCSLLSPSYCAFAFGTMRTRSSADARTTPYTCALVMYLFTIVTVLSCSSEFIIRKSCNNCIKKICQFSPTGLFINT